MLELLTQEDLLTSQYRACSINKTKHILILLIDILKLQNVVLYHKIHISKNNNFESQYS